MSAGDLAGVDLPLSERSRRLVEEVIARLPQRWNLVRGEAIKRVTFVDSAEQPSQPTGLARTEFTEDSPYRRTISKHLVILYLLNLSACSDDVVRWVIAHELAHVVSSHLHRFVSEDRAEEIADSLAVGWGFAKEWDAWAAWNAEIWNADHQ